MLSWAQLPPPGCAFHKLFRRGSAVLRLQQPHCPAALPTSDALLGARNPRILNFKPFEVRKGQEAVWGWHRVVLHAIHMCVGSEVRQGASVEIFRSVGAWPCFVMVPLHLFSTKSQSSYGTVFRLSCMAPMTVESQKCQLSAQLRRDSS